MDNWYDEISDNLSEKFGNKLFETNNKTPPINKETTEETEMFNFNNIKDIKYSDIDDFTLLKYEMSLSGQLRKYFKYCIDGKKSINYDMCKEQLQWLLNTSEYFTSKYKLIPFKLPSNNSIHRSSYKFCQRGVDCEYFYKKKGSCSLQHFVHNIILTDIHSLILYLNDKEYDNINHIEVQKTINTISYVLNHMYIEYSNLIYYKYNISTLPKLIKKSFNK